MKLKNSEIKKVRLELLALQENLCSICKFPCTIDEAVLDHDHKHGHIRAVLHRGCNSLLGKNENNAPRYGLKRNQLIAFLLGASEYLDFHEANQTDMIHPSFFTPLEKAERRKTKAKKLRLKNKKLKELAKKIQ